MKMFPLIIASIIAAPLPALASASASLEPAGNARQAGVDLSGRWQLNEDRSDKRPEPGEGPEMRSPGRMGGGRRPGGGGPPGGMGGGMRGGGMRGGGGPRPNPQDVTHMRDAMRAILDAPAEIIVTHKDDEVAFTDTKTGDVIRVLAIGKKMKSTAGGAEHDVTATYKDDALEVESSFGPMKILDTWKISADGKQLERLTKLEGGPGGGDRKREFRRVYERVG
jgi:hypothetical protein